MEKYIPEDIYNNLLRMLTYRKIIQTSETLPKQKLIDTLNNFEYVVISGNRPATDLRGEARARIVLIAPGSKYANKSPEFKKLIKILMRDGNFNELMFVSDRPLTIHIYKYIDEFKAENPNIYIEAYDYSMFIIEIPAHDSSCPHEIMSKEEIAKFCHDHYTFPERLELILTGDPQAVWIGLRHGMVCRITRLSETAGTAITYRYCISGNIPSLNI